MSAGPAGAPAPRPDVLADTLAELTWYEVEAAARRGAVLLWAFGVVEQHGPHLPTGTDVYVPSARLREVRRLLAERDVEALIVPAYYWGVNVVSGSFPASWGVRPELMEQVMADLLAGMARDGFGHVFCFSGHGDALHNRTVHAGVRAGRARSGIDISFVLEPELAERLGLDPDDPCLTRHASPPPSPTSGSGEVDVHAGRWETSLMMHAHPGLVREDVRAQLAPTGLGPDQLAVWRRGYDEARRTTPLGYLGDPASAGREEGQETLRTGAELAADAIEARLRSQGHRG
ncbi:creatininase family protein [Streptomyces profundus]|uniref:creatininase family protein n=1 Tax=Streptomyces profundus TaxID=2867410 RepID=UPI001D16B086|nr:creatininase family protein [Streptomyces sp. MA3_2.13]UED87890.1 creatininase family protein [Streptomyces sp. MA3_2.13]